MAVTLSSFVLVVITILGSGIASPPASGLRRKWPTTTSDSWRATSASVTALGASTARKNGTTTPQPTKPLPEQATVPSARSTRMSDPAKAVTATPSTTTKGAGNWRRFEWHESLIDERDPTTTTPTAVRQATSPSSTTGKQRQMQTTNSRTNSTVIVCCTLAGLFMVVVVVVIVYVWMTRFRKRTDAVDASPSLYLHTIETECPPHGYASQQSTVPYASLDKPPASMSTSTSTVG